MLYCINYIKQKKAPGPVSMQLNPIKQCILHHQTYLQKYYVMQKKLYFNSFGQNFNIYFCQLWLYHCLLFKGTSKTYKAYKQRLLFYRLIVYIINLLITTRTKTKPTCLKWDQTIQCLIYLQCYSKNTINICKKQSNSVLRIVGSISL